MADKKVDSRVGAGKYPLLEKESECLLPERPGIRAWNPPFKFDWSNVKLWGLNLPVYSIGINRLSWIAFLPIWSTIRGKDLRNLVPDDVIRFPEFFPAHFQRIKNADLRYPIDCIWMGGRHYILDGVHRLAKSMMAGKHSVRIRRVKKEHIGLIGK